MQMATITIEEFGIAYEVGRDASAPADAVLRRVIDATLLGDTLAVLDGSPPYVKLFGRDGAFAGTRVGRGSGPGEARRPIAIGRAGSRSFLIAEQTSLMLVGLDKAGSGGMIERIGGDDRAFRGAALGCGDNLYSLLTSNGFEQPGALAAGRTLLELTDTVSRLGPIRANSQLAQPLFMDATDERVVFYTEEADVPRLQIVDCDDRSIASVRVDSLGRQQWYEETATGFSLHPSEPPRPSGLAITPSGILWATQIVHGPAEADSLTLISLLKVGDDVQRVIGLEGWYQVLDSDGVRLVLGTQEPVPRVLVIRTDALLDLIDQRGIDLQKGAGHDSTAPR